MSDLRQCSREFLIDFIALYRNFPCLWKIKSKEYSDRDKKTQAYEALIEKFKEIDKSATRDSVTKKINSMRTTYSKELAKVRNSIHSGAGEVDIYKPTLWYFDQLEFLDDQDTPRESTSTIDDDSTRLSDIMSQQVVKPHIPLIKFRKGGNVQDFVNSLLGSTPPPRSSSGSSNTSLKGTGIEESEMPNRYLRKPMSKQEMETIERGGPE